jgi:hypothetical protein
MVAFQDCSGRFDGGIRGKVQDVERSGVHTSQTAGEVHSDDAGRHAPQEEVAVSAVAVGALAFLLVQLGEEPVFLGQRVHHLVEPSTKVPISS